MHENLATHTKALHTALAKILIHCVGPQCPHPNKHVGTQCDRCPIFAKACRVGEELQRTARLTIAERSGRAQRVILRELHALKPPA